MGFLDFTVVMKSLLNEGKYADNTISCRGRDFKGHHAIICSKSLFFDAALRGGYQVGFWIGLLQ
jgi:hypothetical protein